MDEEPPVTDRSGLGCDFCRPNPAKPRPLDRESGTDVGDSFQRKFFYTEAYLWLCPRCGITWLDGYWEDDSADPLAEWGKRRWVSRALTSELVEQIVSARGKQTLDLETFGR